MMHFFQKIKPVILAGFLICTQISFGQAYRFRNYGIADNLPSGVVYTLSQDNSGYLWVGTPEGLARFDGF